MTTLYLIRHCQPNTSAPEGDRYFPLTEKGYADVPKVTDYFLCRPVDVVYCSPYRRSIETIRGYCDASGQEMHIVEDFREVKIGEDYEGSFGDTVRRLWEDYTYRLSDGESYGQVQARCLAALDPLLDVHRDQHIAVSMHSTAMSTILRHFKPDFGWADYLEVLSHTPYIATLTLDGRRLVGVEYAHFDA